MRFGDNDDAADALRGEAVKSGLKDLCVCGSSRGDENVRYLVDVTEDSGITVRQFNEDMSTKCFQPSIPCDKVRVGRSDLQFNGKPAHKAYRCQILGHFSAFVNTLR